MDNFEQEFKDLMESPDIYKVESEQMNSKLDVLKVGRYQKLIKGEKQDREQRLTFANRIFIFLCIYMFVCLVILILVGCGTLSIDTSVMVALLSTTTANVIGIFAFVVRYLFKV